MQQKINVRFNINPKVYSFLGLDGVEFKKGDFVIVETALGQGYGKVDSVESVSNDNTLELKKVIRKADETDALKNEENKEKARLVIEKTKELVEKLNLDMNVVNAEYSFDSSKVLIDFISEDRVDFRELVKELAGTFRTRIELRQIGIRDQAKMVGGIGICGRTCCCSTFLKDFEKVSIKMAKVQGLSLNPTKISGSCGRLMCCLEYENPYYSEVYPLMPKLNSEVKTPDGVGTVLYANALKQIASVRIEKEGLASIKDFKFDEIKPVGNNFEKIGNKEGKIFDLERAQSIEDKKPNNSDKFANKNTNLQVKDSVNLQAKEKKEDISTEHSKKKQDKNKNFRHKFFKGNKKEK